MSESNRRMFLKETVIDAARRRISWLFDEFENVCASVSGGKDSTVIFELTLAEAKKRNRLPLDVLFVDQECEWLSTIENIRSIKARDGVNMLWVQSSFKINNGTSTLDDYFTVFDKTKKDLWIRPKEGDGIDIDLGPDCDWYHLFQTLSEKFYGDQKVAFIGGVRCEESPNRALALTSQETYKGATWGKILNKKTQQITFYPIYDWSYSDVWKAIHDNGWVYNTVYDAMYQYGVSIHEMRVSSLSHESSVRHMFWLQEIEKDNYNKIVARISGAKSSNKMNQADFYCPKNLPFMFHSWSEYRDYLVDNLIATEAHRDSFHKGFKDQDELYGPFLGDSLRRKQIDSVLTNDFGFWKLKNVMRIKREDWDAFKRHRAKVRAKRKEQKESGLTGSLDTDRDGSGERLQP